MNDELFAQFARAMLERQDAVIAWLAKVSEQLATQEKKQTSTYIVQAGKTQSLLDLFAALALPSSPELTREQTINAVTPTMLYKNDSIPFARIEIQNDDIAQWIYLGKRNVSVPIGRILMPQAFDSFVLPQGDEIWAICIVATVSLRISEAYDLLGAAQVIREQFALTE